METFSADWLALREPADRAARSTRLEASLVSALRRAGHQPLTVIDLGAGAGSNARHLIPRLPMSQRWLLVDHDRSLLDVALQRTDAAARAHGFQPATPGQGLRFRRADITIDVDIAKRDLSALDADLFQHEGPLLVTAAALLDLTSVPWIAELADRCRAVGATALFALTYDGRILTEPPDAFDKAVRELVNTHQRGDKGFGPAAGPDATLAAVRAFESAGFAVEHDISDWQLGPQHKPLQQQLVAGWAAAATEMVPASTEVIAAWRERRLRAVAEARSRVVVGHRDVLAYPRSSAR